MPHVNETHYLAKAKQYWQPDWCAGDLFLESGKAHLTFYWTVGVLTKWFALPTVAWIGRLAAWLALAIAWQRLNRTVTGLPLRAVLSAMLLVTLIDWTNFRRRMGHRRRRRKMLCVCVRLLGLGGAGRKSLANRLALLRLGSGVSRLGRRLVGDRCNAMVWLSQSSDQNVSPSIVKNAASTSARRCFVPAWVFCRRYNCHRESRLRRSCKQTKSTSSIACHITSRL